MINSFSFYSSLSIRQLFWNNITTQVALRFDKDENVIDEPFFLSSRLEMVDKCRAIVMLLSRSYMTCPVNMYETKVREQSDTCEAKLTVCLIQ